MEEGGGGKKRELGLWTRRIVSLIAVGLSMFQIYTAFFGVLESTRQRSIHLSLILILVFLLQAPSSKLKKSRLVWVIDLCFILLVLASYGYVIMNSQEIASRMSYVTDLTAAEMLFGVLGIAILIEAARRTMGNVFAGLLAVFVAYVFVGPYIKGSFGHQGYSLMWTVDHIFYTREGIFGTPLGVSATYIYIFLLFGAFLERSGAGEFFMNLALALTGRYRGGPAKTAVVASGIMGTISGSAVANVVTTGSFTIPLMKKIGYQPRFAGAVEAVASTGGQIMPPIMGAAAFIMAEFTGIPYIKIAAAAIFPAFLYYFSLGWQIHFRAVRQNMRGLTAEETPHFGRILRSGFLYLIPIVVIIALLAVGYTPLKAGMYALVTVWACTLVNLAHPMGLRQVWEALEAAAKTAIDVAVACAAAGIVVGVVSLTGLGIKFSTMIIQAAGGHLILALTFTMLAALVLGMGLPTSAAYIIQAAIVIPSLVKLGVPVLAAHMFAFYFAIVSAITPPVALAAYAGAGISGADPFKTGFTAWRLGLAGFIVPFMFVYGPSLLLQGSPGEIALTVVSASIGVISLASALEGYLIRQLSLWERALLLFGAVVLIKPGLITDVVGIGLLILVLLRQWHVGRQGRIVEVHGNSR